MSYPVADITAAVLAGGQGLRMGGQDKGLVEIHGRPLIAHVLARLQGQAGRIVINANRNLDFYRQFAWPVISDGGADYHGPLAGMAAALRACETPYLLCVPCDAPVFPVDLGPRLYAALGAGGLCAAHDGERTQPMFALMRRDLLPDLEDFLAGGGRTVMKWFDRHLLVADFSASAQAFNNANTPAQRRQLEQVLC